MKAASKVAYKYRLKGQGTIRQRPAVRNLVIVNTGCLGRSNRKEITPKLLRFARSSGVRFFGDLCKVYVVSCE